MDTTTKQPVATQGHEEKHEHPTWSTYWKVALILTVITAVEVWVYYTPFQYSRFFNLSLVLMSATKFVIVVMFYMHLKYDHKLFRSLFVGPAILATITFFALLFLLGRLKLGA